jgi:hypothetical protein
LENAPRPASKLEYNLITMKNVAFVLFFFSQLLIGSIEGSLMPRIISFFDESGAKGHADKEEIFDGESGNVAGFVIREDALDQNKHELLNILRPFAHDGKMHITDLDPTQQSALREDVFCWLLRNACPCFYDAQYVRGFGNAGRHLRELIELARDSSSPRFRHGNNLPAPESLHRELFQGFALKVLFWCKGKYGADFCIDYFTDRVDKDTLRLFEKALRETVEFLSPQNLPRTTETTFFDVHTKTVGKKMVTSHVETLDRWKTDRSQFGEVKLADYDSPFIVVADVIANSLNHHFVELQQRSKGLPLCSAKAVNGHPLCDLFIGLSPSDEPEGIDAYFRHPENMEED